MNTEKKPAAAATTEANGSKIEAPDDAATKPTNGVPASNRYVNYTSAFIQVPRPARRLRILYNDVYSCYK